MAWLRNGQYHPNDKKQGNESSLFHINLPWCNRTHIWHFSNNRTRRHFPGWFEIITVSMLPSGKLRHNCRTIRLCSTIMTRIVLFLSRQGEKATSCFPIERISQNSFVTIILVMDSWFANDYQVKLDTYAENASLRVSRRR